MESPLGAKKQPESGFSAFALLHVPGGYIAALAGFLIALALTIAVPGGGMADTVAGQMLERPFYLPWILAGLMCGCFCYSQQPSKIGLLAWVLPGLVLAWRVWSWQQTM